MPLVATFSTNWFQVITDLNRLKLSTYEISRELGVSKSAVIGWKMGAEPKHVHGEALIALWCRETGSQRDYAPTVLHKQWWIYNR